MVWGWPLGMEATQCALGTVEESRLWAHRLERGKFAAAPAVLFLFLPCVSTRAGRRCLMDFPGSARSACGHAHACPGSPGPEWAPFVPPVLTSGGLLQSCSQ